MRSLELLVNEIIPRVEAIAWSGLVIQSGVALIRDHGVASLKFLARFVTVAYFIFSDSYSLISPFKRHLGIQPPHQG